MTTKLAQRKTSAEARFSQRDEPLPRRRGSLKLTLSPSLVRTLLMIGLSSFALGQSASGQEEPLAWDPALAPYVLLRAPETLPWGARPGQSRLSEAPNWATGDVTRSDESDLSRELFGAPATPDGPKNLKEPNSLEEIMPLAPLPLARSTAPSSQQEPGFPRALAGQRLAQQQVRTSPQGSPDSSGGLHWRARRTPVQPASDPRALPAARELPDRLGLPDPRGKSVGRRSVRSTMRAFQQSLPVAVRSGADESPKADAAGDTVGQSTLRTGQAAPGVSPLWYPPSNSNQAAPWKWAADSWHNGLEALPQRPQYSTYRVPYAYGWFGARGSRSRARSFGYNQGHTQWTIQ